MTKKTIFSFFFILLISCNKKVEDVSVVYSNDFENAELANIDNGIINRFNGTAVLGNYNNGYFALSVASLPKHDLVTVSFDLYIHDSWDGNKSSPDGPDIWQMLVDGNPYINATFSNDECAAGNFCSPQSYPFIYPNNYNNPKNDALRTDLPGFCNTKPKVNGTTMYKIEKTFRHSKNTLLLQCLDKLVQTNTTDPKCDESWSVDNIQIKAIRL